MLNMKALYPIAKFFFQEGQRSRSTLPDKTWFDLKGLFTRIIYVKSDELPLAEADKSVANLETNSTLK